MSYKLDNFKKQLDKLKDKGVEIDPDQVIADILKPIEKKEEFNDWHWSLLERKVKSIMGDYKDFYHGKGCGLKVLFYVSKPDSADTFTESFDYNKDMQVISTVEIGTEGKYIPVDCIGDKNAV